MSYQLGMDAVLYYEAGGYSADANDYPDISGGIGTAVDIVKNVTLNLEKAEADVTTRGNNGWRANVGTLKDGSINAQIQWDTDNAAFTALMTAWLENSVIGVAVLDEAYVSGSAGTGLVANCSVINFTRNEELEDAIVADVVIKPTYSAVKPDWLDSGSSTGPTPTPTA